jgi:peptide/nickel transport system ATP-binding protein
MSVVAETCDRVGVMYAGDIVETGSVEEVIFNPLHPYTKGLMAAIPSEDKKKLEGIPGVVPELVSPPPGCRFHPRCPRLMDICSSVKPSFHEAGKAHRVACHLY